MHSTSSKISLLKFAQTSTSKEHFSHWVLLFDENPNRKRQTLFHITQEDEFIPLIYKSKMDGNIVIKHEIGTVDLTYDKLYDLCMILR